MRTESGFSLIELLMVVAIILIIAAIAIPNFVQARMSSNEAAAVSAIRSITNAQLQHKILNATVGYAPDLAALGPSGAGFLSADLGSAPFTKTGYQFSTAGTMETFTVSATPVTPGTSGRRSFCSDTPAVIRYALQGSTCDPATAAVLAQ